MKLSKLICVATLCVVFSSSVTADENTPDKWSERPVEKARRTYMGRIVAQPMSHLGAPWLIRPERNQEENAELSFEKLEIKPE